MSAWNGMTYEGKENLLRVVRAEAERFFALVSEPDAWEAPTACEGWEVRDVVGHLVDATEGYFPAFDAARGTGAAEAPYGVRGMAARVDDRSRAFRGTPQVAMTDRLRGDFAKLMEIFDALGPDDWGGLTVPHFYMGPLPAFFYPAFQLMDYGVHSWDIREGSGRAHALSGEAADLLVPFMFVLWQATADPEAAGVTEATELGLRVTSGPNAGGTRLRMSPEGLTYEPGPVDDLPTVLEFDPASLVLTAFGRAAAGTVRGDVATAERYLDLFFRI